ncbi:MAG: tRNA guanosine(34) transglycosylase Tgt [Spirochaetales bacterium]
MAEKQMHDELFQVEAKDPDGRARCGVLHLPHGSVETPVFMPVGTNGTVKAMIHEELEEIGFSLILGNTYHLYLRPGMEVIQHFKSLHSFTGWRGNILTDSGGFQVFSLAPFRKITREGVRFRSHIDGSSHVLTPERVVEIQRVFGSDILMPLDVCTSFGTSYKEALKAVEFTTDWAARSRRTWEESMDQGKGVLFGIVQGNFFRDLRKKSAEELLELDFPGMAIGGLSVGEPFQTFLEMLSHTARLLPEDKPRYLMGIGTPEFILEAVDQGIDMFDCVFLTRIARNGTAFTRTGRIALKREAFLYSEDPLETTCTCKVCQRYSRGYLRHLFKAGEISGPVLLTYHNLYFLNQLVKEIRSAIRTGRFQTFKKEFLSRWTSPLYTIEDR